MLARCRSMPDRCQMSVSADLAGFALASVLIELTPGPNMTYLAVLSARQGRVSGYVAVLGVALGLAIMGGPSAKVAA